MSSKMMVAVALSLCAAFAGAEVKKLSDLNMDILKIPYNKLTDAQRKERDEVMYWSSLIEDGGEMRMPGTPSGTIRYINLQKKVPAEKLKRVLKAFEPSLRYDIAIVDADCAATLKINIVDKPDAPALLVAPDDAWAQVNVAKLGDEKTKPPFLAARTRKEMLRAFAYLTAGSTYGMALYQKPESLKSFDDIADEDFSIDIIMRATKYLGAMGVRPIEESTYKSVLFAGYDIAPTNEYQKAIYENVKKVKPFTKKAK